MRIVTGFFTSIIDTENGFLNTLVIEEPRLFNSFVNELYSQLSGRDGRITVSEKDKPCSFSKKVEIVDRLVPFEVNTKALLSKLNIYFEQNALGPEYYEIGMQLLSEIEDYFNSMTMDLPCDVVFTKLNLGALVKALGIELRNDYHNLAEQVLDYLELVRVLERDKLLVFLNLRSFVSDTDLEIVSKDIVAKGYHVLLVDSHSRRRIPLENRITIDDDLCEI
ncbi:MAG: type II-A CRISPR-associated protein Csn2 [Lachnospiraceae bacterium]|nr:type II-A CRISPR-associated protein Csn2 [Lachnospiraceae bacterium]